MVVTLREITDGNREGVLALRVAPEQERFVSSVRVSLEEAATSPHAKPWYRAVYADDEPAGFYARLGFVPTGKLTGDGEVIARLVLP